LLAAEFVPASPDKYPDRPQTPPPKRKEGEAAATPSANAATSAAPAAYVPPVGRYVAPGARKGGMSLAERMRKERETATMGATKVTPKGISGAFAGKKLPVGMAPADQGKSKNALRKERQRLAKDKQEQVEEEKRQQNEQEEKARVDAAANDPVKKTKKLNKVLKQIVELKKKDLASLNEDQKKKIASEAEILQQLAELKVS